MACRKLLLLSPLVSDVGKNFTFHHFFISFLTATFDISPLNIEVFCIKNSDFVKIISEKNRKLSRSSLIANENGLCIMVKLVFITESDRSKHYDRATAFRQVISNVSMMREKVLQKIHNDAGLCNGAMSSSRPSSDVFSSVDSQLNDGSEVCTTRVQLLKLIQSSKLTLTTVFVLFAHVLLSNPVYPPNGKIITMLDYLIASRPDLITAQTKQTRDQIHCISTISFATFGDFYACDQFANKSTIACARKAFEYFKSLFFLLIQLKLHFTEKKSLELFQQLPRTIVKEYSLVSSSPSGPMYIHAISLERMCAFSQADSSCDAARTGAVLQLIEYLSQFLQAIDI